jgi:hypothetical protein
VSTDGGVTEVMVDHRVASSLREGFDYITDPVKWPEYWPGLVAIDPGSRWRRPGDRARLTFRMMGRSTELVMILGNSSRTGSTIGSSSATGHGADREASSTGLSSAAR